MINGISGVNFNNNYYQTKNVNSKVHQNRVSVFDTPTIEPIKTDSVNFKSKNKEKDVYKTYSCKDADFLKYDLEYIDNWSIMLDIKIIIKTVFIGL